MAFSITRDRRAAHNLWIIFWVAFAVRVLYITLAHTYHIRPAQDHFQFGWEMGRVARALATGHGYANPFVGHTGPTAWVPPLYPLLLAGVFKLFGVYTALSAWVILTINSVFSAATAPLIYRISTRCYNRKVAVWSAWIWALYPAAMQYAVRWVWEMSLTAFLFTAVLLLALRMKHIGEVNPEPRRQTTPQWLLFGSLWGLIALLNPTLLLFLPACGIWILTSARPLAAGFGKAVLAALLFSPSSRRGPSATGAPFTPSSPLATIWERSCMKAIIRNPWACRGARPSRERRNCPPLQATWRAAIYKAAGCARDDMDLRTSRTVP